MNTFFFGYLSLKWRRLVRFIVLSPSIILFSMYIFVQLEFVYNNNYDEVKNIIRWYSALDYEPIIFNFLLMISPVISWLGKPFVVKEK